MKIHGWLISEMSILIWNIADFTDDIYINMVTFQQTGTMIFR